MTGLSGFGARPAGGGAVDDQPMHAETGTKPGGCAVVARARTALALALLNCASGCLLPYWDLHEEPPLVNSMPVILPDSIVPQRTRDPVVVEIGVGCQHQTFSATVLDYDGAPEVHFKWLLTASITAERARTGDLAAGSVTASALPVDTIIPGLSEHAPLATSYKLELPLTREVLAAEFDDPNGLAGEKRTHFLQLWVSDRRFGAGEDNTTPQTPEDEAPQPADSASWLIEIQNTSGCDAAVEVVP